MIGFVKAVLGVAYSSIVSSDVISSESADFVSLLQRKATVRKYRALEQVLQLADASQNSTAGVQGFDSDTLQKLAALLRESGVMENLGSSVGAGKEKMTLTSSVVVHPPQENASTLISLGDGTTVSAPQEKLVWTRTVGVDSDDLPSETDSAPANEHIEKSTLNVAQAESTEIEHLHGDQESRILSEDAVKQLEEIARQAVEKSRASADASEAGGSRVLSVEALSKLEEIAEKAAQKAKISEKRQEVQEVDVNKVKMAEEVAQLEADKAQAALDRAKEAEKAKEVVERAQEEELAKEAEGRAKDAERAKAAALKAKESELRARQAQKEKQAEELAEDAAEKALEAEKVNAEAEKAKKNAEKAAERARSEAIEAKEEAEKAKASAESSKEPKIVTHERERSTTPTQLSKSLTFSTGWAEAQSAANLSVISAADMDRRVTKLLFDSETVRDAFAALSGEQRATPPMGFIKTHRTGSSTLSSIIHRIGDQRNLSFVLPAGDKHANALGWPGAFPGVEALAFNGAPMHQFDIVCNNAVFNSQRMKEYLKPSPLFFTVLRSPVAQVESSFEFFHPPCDAGWDSRINWLENLNRIEEEKNMGERGPVLKAQFRNSQAADLGWYEHSRDSDDDHDDGAISEWIDGIDSSFGLVVLTEYFNEGLALLRRKLGLDTSDLRYIRMKRGSPAREKPTDEQIERVKDLNHVDQRLYEHFNRTFWKHWDAAGGWSVLGSEVRELRARNEVLERACSEEDDNECPWAVRADSAEYTEYLRKRQIKMVQNGELQFESMTIR